MRVANHMEIPFSPPDIREEDIRQVVDTLRSGWLTTGPKTKRFEEQIAAYCGTQKAVCLSSATAALELTLRVLGVGPGDEVITSCYTYTASASVVCHTGARLVLVDTAPGSFEMDYQRLAEAVTSRTKAVIAVDLAGIICDYDKIFEIVSAKSPLFCPKGAIQERLGRVAVIADGAHALGASRKGIRCGAIADFTAFSFHAVKNLTTGEGGAVTWHLPPGFDPDCLYRQFQLLSMHGQTKDALEKGNGGNWEYDIVAPYYKCNMTDIAAALGLAQLARYEESLARRHALIEYYDQGLRPLAGSTLRHTGKTHRSSGHLYMLRLPGVHEPARNRIIGELARRGVSANVHYKPLPMLTAYRAYGVENYPNAYAMYENEITLPLNTCLTDEQAEYVVQSVIKVIKTR